MKKECRKYIEWKKKHPEHKVKTVSQYAADEDDSETQQSPDMCFKACTGDTSPAWYVDSGATSHMSAVQIGKDVTRSYVPTVGEPVVC